MFVAKGFLHLQWIGGDPQHLGLDFGECASQPAEIDRLLGTARRVRAWIEEQDERNAGALAPATSTDDFPAGGLAAAAFEGAAPADLDGLNRLDGALCEASLTALLLDLTVVARPLLACFVWCFLSVDAVDGARAGLRAGVLGDFLRVFLDMRLPFVAFGGSIIRLLQVSSPHLDSGRRLGKSDSRGVWLEEIRRTTRLLVECASEVQ